MTRDNFFNYLQKIAITLLLGALALAIYRRQTEPRPSSSYYFLAKQSVRERLLPRKLAGFSPPSDLRVERVDAFETNVLGWATVTNAASASVTQWFQVTFRHRSGSHSVTGVRFLASEPPAANTP